MAQTKIKNSSLSILPLQGLMYAAPFLIGLFHEWSAGLAALFLIGWLFAAHIRERFLRIPKNISMLSLAVISLFYLISSLWAIDRGMAVFGFIKFLPLPLFALAVYPLNQTERERLLQTVPLSGAVMTLLALALSRVPALSDFFQVNSRLAGFFQYPNTFAMFLLAGVILILSRKNTGWQEALYLVILLGGIVLSGSRTVFILLAAVAGYYLITAKNRRTRWTLAILLSATIAAAAIYALVTGDLSSAARYLTTSLSSSTFVGRFLYFRDAIPQILSHPLGLGYMGYHYAVGSFQTGVYSLLHVHNDLLQLMLDIGWLPAILLVWALAKSFFAKDCPSHRRVLLLALCAHALFDFDFQYICFWFLLILLMDLDAGFTIRWKSASVSTGLWAVLAALCLYFSAASGAYYLNAHTAATKIYPGYTDAWLQLLPKAETAEDMESVADKILRKNDSVSLAYSAKARAAYARGDFGAVIEHKTRALALSPYELQEYLDYFDMLTVGMDLYIQAGDEASATRCREELLSIPDRMDAVLENTSPLGWKINDRPSLQLPTEYRQYLWQLENN